MRRGKEVSQGAHASLAFIGRRIQRALERPFGAICIPLWFLSKPVRDWFLGSYAKVVCQVDSEEELRAIHQKALDAGLESHLIIDSGRTEFHGVATPTTCGIGPDYSDKFEGVTNELKLY